MSELTYDGSFTELLIVLENLINKNKGLLIFFLIVFILGLIWNYLIKH